MGDEACAPSASDRSSEEIALVAIFDGTRLASRATAFRGGSLLAWFGGIDVDLREAQLASDARLSVSALFGGISIRVPETWRVESRAQTLAGGIEVRTEATDESVPTLTLEGTALFGGVTVSAQPRRVEL